MATRGKFGRAYYCRLCAAEKRREHYRKPEVREREQIRARDAARALRVDPEWAAQDRERCRTWKKSNPEHVNRKTREWYASNTEKVRAMRARWLAANPGKANEYVERRRARKAAAPVNDFTASDWREVLAEFNYSCAYCLVRGVPLQQDHMTPLSRDGEHSRCNIVPACGKCNNRKGTRDILGFLSMGVAA